MSLKFRIALANVASLSLPFKYSCSPSFGDYKKKVQDKFLSMKALNWKSSRRRVKSRLHVRGATKNDDHVADAG